MDKQQGIIVDIHHTLLSDKNELNAELFNMIKVLSKEYYILAVTASYYKNKKQLEKELGKELLAVFDELYYNTQQRDYVTRKKYNDADDKKIKLNIYKLQIMPIYEIAAIIDNNKHICKAFAKIGIDSLRFKSADDN